MEPSKQIPEAFFCELTEKVMKDPVLDHDGHSYERAEIVEYIHQNGFSPITLEPLKVNDLIPNIALKKTIESFFINEPDLKFFLDQPLNDQDKKQANQIPDHVINDQEHQKLINSKNDLYVEASSIHDHVLLSIVPPNKIDGIHRTPSCVVVVIDISGSMGNEAKIQSEDKNETFGFNTLDLVKHAIKTIIKSTNKNDKLALVSFSNNASIVLELTTMDEAGQKKANNALNNLKPDASTNLWDGLYRGMEVLRMRKEYDIIRNSAVLLLTDGMPNVEPPRGHIPQLLKYKEDIGGELPGIINTFGFGYSLDSVLLNEIAVIGKGTYAFIPDGSFVGTVFVNSMSNLFSNKALNVEVEVDLSNVKVDESDLLNLFKYYDQTSNSKFLKVKLGSMQFGQNKGIILPILFNNNENKILKGNLKYTNPFGEPFNSDFNYNIANIHDSQVDINYFRVKSSTKMLEIVSQLKTNLFEIKALKDCLGIITTLINEINSSPVKENPYIKDLITDLKEQVSLALSSKEFYSKWGRHYLPSLARAHLLQQCNNFKDPGVQNFGGEVFKVTRDKLDELFLNLPAPEPSIKRKTNKVVKNMATFYNHCGGCIHGSCNVLMGDGSYKLVKEIQKGDIIASDSEKSAQVKCVLKMPINGKKTELVSFSNGLKITPYHPVKIDGGFQFPINVGNKSVVECDAVYNFILNEHHIMKINGTECVTLGHGLVNNDVVKHAYLGTQEVIKDLQKIDGYEKGLINLKNEWFLRDEETGIINKIMEI